LRASSERKIALFRRGGKESKGINPGMGANGKKKGTGVKVRGGGGPFPTTFGGGSLPHKRREKKKKKYNSGRGGKDKFCI